MKLGPRRLATVSWVKGGEYVTSITWHADGTAWRSLPGVNKTARVPRLDAHATGERTMHEHIGQMTAEILDGVLHDDCLRPAP